MKTIESRKMSGRKMTIKARAAFIFLPGIFLLTAFVFSVCANVS
jgi:hypothetical protein